MDFATRSFLEQSIEKLDLEGVLNVEGDSTTDDALIRAGILKASNWGIKNLI